MISASSHPTKTGTAIFRKSAQGTKKVKITCRNSEVLNGYFGLELEDAEALRSRRTFSFGLKPVTTAVYRDDLSVVQQAVKDGANGRHIAEQFAPFFDRSIGSHHSGAVFVAAHDEF
jgi:hypothetical protein